MTRIDAIIIHGRTYKDGFSGAARWENIYKVKEMLGDKITVIGNGDVGQIISKSEFLISNKIAKFQILNSKFLLDGVAIGRASFGKPWVFSEAEENPKSEYRNPKQIQNPKFKILKSTILDHAKLAEKTKGKKGIVEFRKHLLTYMKGFPSAKKLRMEAVKIETIAEIKSVLSQLEQ